MRTWLAPALAALLPACTGIPGADRYMFASDSDAGASPASDAGSGFAAETLWIDAAWEQGVISTSTLAAGSDYSVDIEGTVSLWSAEAWKRVCAGTPDPSPEFPSTSTTGPVGLDSEYAYAWIVDSPFCPQGHATSPPPLPLSRVQISLDGSMTRLDFLLHPSGDHLASDHLYHYVVGGTGHRVRLRAYDDPGRYADNYGRLKVTIDRAP